MLRDIGARRLGTGRVRRASVARRDTERTSEENRRPAVVHEHDPPESDPELTLLRVEDFLSGRVMVQAELDAQSNETTDEAPEGAALTLKIADEWQIVSSRMIGGTERAA